MSTETARTQPMRPDIVSRIIDLAPAIGLFAAIGIVWEMSVKIFAIPGYLLPAPSAIAAKLWEARDMLLQNLAYTMTAAILGFVIGTLVAVGLAILFLYSKAAERALFPWAITLKAIPILAIAPLLTIWLGFGLAPKVAIAAIACFFPTLVNTVKGLRTLDRQSLEFLAVVGATRAQTFRHARIYAALPYIFAAAKVSSSIAVIGAIVAEFTGANFGIGTVIVTAGYQQDAAMLFSAIVASSIATILMFYLVIAIEKLTLYWPEAQVDS
jgi:NitT/TauT family transport system permease protein